MTVVILVSIFCILLTYFESIKKLKHGMLIGFCGVTILYCIHYDFGTDYMTYYHEFLRVESFHYKFYEIFDLDNWRNGEFGWGLMQWLCAVITGKNGFFLLVFVNSILENIIIYRFIRKYSSPLQWPFAVFVYLFTSNFYLLGFSMMRQWLAMCLIIYAFDYIVKKRVLISLAIIFIASTIHHTASILFPIAFLSYLPLKYAKYYSITFLVVFMLLMFIGDFLNSILAIFMTQSDTIEHYITNYNGFEANKGFGIGFIINLLPFVLSVLFLFKSRNAKNTNNKMLIILSCIGTMVIPFSQSLAMVNRMSLYFTLFSIATIPIIYSTIPNRLLRQVLTAIFIFMQIVSYRGFLIDPSYQFYYNEFQTIFSKL